MDVKKGFWLFGVGWFVILVVAYVVMGDKDPLANFIVSVFALWLLAAPVVFLFSFPKVAFIVAWLVLALTVIVPFFWMFTMPMFALLMLPTLYHAVFRPAQKAINSQG